MSYEWTAPLTLAFEEPFERLLTQRFTTSSSSMMLDRRSISPSEPASSSTISWLERTLSRLAEC